MVELIGTSQHLPHAAYGFQRELYLKGCMAIIKKIIICILITILAIIIAAVTLTLLTPSRRSVEKIKKDILKLTPIGSSMEHVKKIINEYDTWELMYISTTSGFLKQDASKPITVIGEQSIRVFMGEHYDLFIFTTSVCIFWGFDGDGKLIDVWIWKTVSAT